MPEAWIDGASGFLGTHLSALLVARGWDVTAASVRPGSPAAIPADATVFHLAGLAHDGGRGGGEAMMRINRDLTLSLQRKAAAAGARAFVFVSSAAVLGDGRVEPAAPDARPRPAGAYAESKAAAEAALLASAASLPLAIVRPPLVHGTGVKANLLRVLGWLGRGRPFPAARNAGLRSLVSAANLASALEAIARATPGQRRPRIWHVTDGEDVAFPELCRRLCRALGVRARQWPVPAPLASLAAARLGRGSGSNPFSALRLDDSELRGELGWAPVETLDESLARMANWFRAQ